MNKLSKFLMSGSVALSTLVGQSGVAFADVRNIVLVHGANVDGSTWRDVYDRLTAQNYTVSVAQLPLTSFEDDVAAVQRNLDTLDGPVLLVGHSYGGAVISEVGMNPDVKGLVYVAAFQPEAGESGGGLLASTSTEFTADKLRIFDDGHYLIDEATFLSLVGNGLSEQDAIYVARSQAMSHTGILAHKARAAAWTEKPSWSAIATLDRTISPELQRQMSERARSIVVEIENGHMLPMTNPDEVADVIRQAAEAVD